MIPNELWHRQRERMRKEVGTLEMHGYRWEMWWKRLYTLPSMDKHVRPGAWVSYAGTKVR